MEWTMATNTIDEIPSGTRCLKCGGFGTIVDLGKCCRISELWRADLIVEERKAELNRIYGKFGQRFPEVAV